MKSTVKKIMSCVACLMLSMSMMFASTPISFANEFIPNENTPIEEQINVVNDTFSANLNNLAVAPPSTIEEQTEDKIETPQITPSPLNRMLQNDGDSPTLFMAPSSSIVVPSMKPYDLFDYAQTLKKLTETVAELARVVTNIDSLTIVRIDEGYLNDEDPTAIFEEASYGQVISLINEINGYRAQLGQSEEITVNSLPISPLGELPEGFEFDGTNLTLTDFFLFFRNIDLGEDENTATRSYTIDLKLNSGISYIDDALRLLGVPYLAAESFTIELELINSPGGGVIPPPPPTPIDPLDPANPTNPGDSTDPDDPDNPDTPIDQDGNTGDSGNQGEIGSNPGNTNNPSLPNPTIPLGQGSNLASSIIATIGEEDTQEPDDSRGTEDPAANNTPENIVTPNPLLTIQPQQIPMASMMLDDRGNINAANVFMVTFSMVVTILALSSVRVQGFRGQSEPVAGAATPNPLGTALGALCVGLGLLSITLFVSSQYIVTEPLNSSIPWTAILIILFIAQIAGLVGMAIANHLAAKKAAKARLQVRY